MSLLELRNISLKYKNKKVEAPVFDSVDLTVEEGEFCVVLGKNSSGKTSLLNIIAGLQKASTGEVVFDEKNLQSLRGRKLAKFYRDKLAYVRQSDNLFDDLSVSENFAMATRYSKMTLNLKSALKVVGMSGKENAYPSQLSNSEKQKLAVAFAISKKPKLVLCDEPIAGMDAENAQLVIKLLVQAAHEMGLTVIFATTNESIASVADKSIVLTKTEVEEPEAEVKKTEAEDTEEIEIIEETENE